MFFPYIIISDCDKWFWVQIYGKLKKCKLQNQKDATKTKFELISNYR